MIEQRLLEWDYRILHLFNVKLAHPILDQFWLFITQLHKNVYVQWLVFPALLLLLLYMCRWQAWKVLVTTAAAVALADVAAYRGIKSLIQRARPFENPEIADWLRKVGEAHGPSFPSNHAANMFAGAVILSWYLPFARNFFYILALLTAVSRPALGVHYPSDALAGACLGIFVASLVRTLVLNQWRTLWLENRASYSHIESEGWRARFKRQ